MRCRRTTRRSASARAATRTSTTARAAGSSAPDEALVIEIDHLPKRGVWNFQLSNFWMESLDYRHHRIHLNPHTACSSATGRCGSSSRTRSGPALPELARDRGPQPGRNAVPLDRRRRASADRDARREARGAVAGCCTRSCARWRRVERAIRTPCEPLRRHVRSIEGYDERAPARAAAASSRSPGSS
jgi:hypothetical protein